MKITCSKSDLLNSINIVLKAVPAKTTMNILECIVIEVSGSEIKLIANDMELGIETKVKGTILEPGVVALNAKMFSEIIRRLPENDVTISVDATYKATITCEKAVFYIMGKSSEEFPVLPVVQREKSICISQFTLREIIRQTVFSISDNENNKIMTGELFEITGNKLRVVSLDGHRISVRKIELKESYDSLKVIVPGKTLNEVSKIISGEMDDMITIYFTEKHIMFEFGDTLVLSRLIEGEYYKIDQMLSGDYETKITVDKKEFLSCMDRTTLFVKESEKKPVVFNIAGSTINLKINSSLGSMNEEIDIEKEGKDILIGFNPKFIIDALRVIDDEKIDIYLFNPKAPCFIKDKDENYLYLILPINLNTATN